MGPLPFPSLGFSGGSAFGGTVGGGNGWNQGSWTVNLAGSGTALQSGGMSPLLIAAGLVALVLVFHR